MIRSYLQRYSAAQLGFSSIILLTFACSCLMILPLRAQQDTIPVLRQAERLAQQGNLRGAERLLLSASRSNPNSFEVFQLLGMVYLKDKNPTRAESALKRAIMLSGRKDSRSLFLLCETEFDLKKVPEAIHLARELSPLAAKDPRVHYALGHLLYKTSKFKIAILELERAHSFAPPNPLVAGDLVMALDDSGRTSSADKLLSDFLTSASYQDLVQLGSWFGNNDHIDFTVRSLERAVSLRREDYNGLFERTGLFLPRLGHLNRPWPSPEKLSRCSQRASRQDSFLSCF